MSVMSSLQTRLASLLAPATVRPIVVIESDDWGRCGAPSREAINSLIFQGLLSSPNAWDYYGLESTADIQALGDCLASIGDRDGNPACLSAKVIVANLDVEALSNSRVTGHLVIEGVPLIPLDEGLPAPWSDRLPDAYRAAEMRGVFRAGLHGLTHFCLPVLAGALNENSERGNRIRAVLATGTPYLRSLTPELSFALIEETHTGDKPITPDQQRVWMTAAVEIFERVFGRRPLSFCAPGYRHDTNTTDLLRELGIISHELFHDRGVLVERGLVSMGRNVSFEPVLSNESESAIVERALRQCAGAVARGHPIVICSHSVNFIERFNSQAPRGVSCLRRLLESILRMWPLARFVSVDAAASAFLERDPDWFRPPTSREQFERMRALV